MRSLALPLLLLLGAVSARAAASPPPLALGDSLPALSGDYLTGRRAELPAVARGRVALLALGFTYDSRFAVEAWVNRFRSEFPGDSLTTTFEVPMMGGMARVAKPFIDRGMRKGTPRALHENVVTVWHDVSAWKSRLRYREPRAAYLVLLDREGHVAWMHHGAFDETAWSELAAVARTELAR